MFLTLLFGCPSSDDECFDYGSSARVEDLILLTPIQDSFSQGDELLFKVSIPATNSYFGAELNLYNDTNDSFAKLILGFDQLFTGNNLNFVIGSQGDSPNWFNMPFNFETSMYELEFIITLNKVGDYSFVTSDSIEFIGNECNRYRLDTNVVWNGLARIEFNVIE